MELAIEKRSGCSVVRLRGELRSGDGSRATEQIHPLVATRGSATVVDLSGLTMIDSSGLSELVSLNTHARMSGGRLVLAGPTPFVAGVLSVTQLDKWFEMAPDVAAAESLLAGKKS